MRMRLRTAALLMTAGALVLGVVIPATSAAASAQAPPAAPATTWKADLAAGQAAGVDVRAGSARLDQAGAFIAPRTDRGSAEGSNGVPTGLLTFPEHDLGRPTDRVDSRVTGAVPAGSTASVDVRGKRSSGNWSEWIPSTPDATGAARTTLPEATTQVQARLVLTGAGRAVPSVQGVMFTAEPGVQAEGAPAAAVLPSRYRVFATREGLTGGTTANGHVIANRDYFVALPSRRALSPNGKGDYSVRVCASNGRCAFAPVWDVGPWNTRDDYWNPSPQRQQWGNLPQGTPEAQAAHDTGYNGGRDQFNRKVANPAGIDLGDGVFWDALGLRNNAYVTVDYLWTGSTRLTKVVGNAPVTLRSAPYAWAAVAGAAAVGASVPVQCAAGAWVRVGTKEYIAAAAVPQAGAVRPCAGGA